MSSSEKAGPKAGGKWRPGQSGNPRGKPKGTRHKATQLAMGMMHDEAERIVRRVIEGALEGDAVCLRLCLERLVPPVKEHPIALDLPTTDSPEGVSAAQQAIVQAVAAGDLLPGEAATLAGIVEARRKALETQELERRIAALEERHGKA